MEIELNMRSSVLFDLFLNTPTRYQLTSRFVVEVTSSGLLISVTADGKIYRLSSSP